MHSLDHTNLSKEKLFSKLEKIIEEQNTLHSVGEERKESPERGEELSATCVAPRVPLRLRSLSPNQQRGLIELYSKKKNYAERREEEETVVRFRLTILHMAPAVVPMGTPRELHSSCHIIYRSRTLATNLGSRIEHRVASASVDRLRFCALAQHTNPSRSSSIQATGDRCAILRLRLSRQLSLPNPQLKRLTLTRCQRSVWIASRSKIVRSYDRRSLFLGSRSSSAEAGIILFRRWASFLVNYFNSINIIICTLAAARRISPAYEDGTLYRS